jgi:hypothetical protein
MVFSDGFTKFILPTRATCGGMESLAKVIGQQYECIPPLQLQRRHWGSVHTEGYIRRAKFSRQV